MENDLLTGMVLGKRSRGRQKTRMTNTIKEKLGMTMTEAITTAQDRVKWRNIVYAATAFWKPNVLNDSSSSSSIYLYSEWLNIICLDLYCHVIE